MQVSVIIPTYGHQDLVLGTLDSVFAQTFKDFEVIVVNDGSPDDSAAVLKPLADAGRIRYFEQKNGGQSVARNRGIAESKGEFIALLDDDDLWPEDKLQWQVEALKANPESAMVYGRVEAVDDNGAAIVPKGDDGEPMYWLASGPDGDVYKDFMETNYIVSPGECLFRRSHLLSLGEAPFDVAIRGGCDDWDLYLRLSRQFRFTHVDRVALRYRVHAGNASGNIVRMYLSSLSVRRKMFAAERDPAVRAKWWDNYRTYALWLTWMAMESLSNPKLRAAGWNRAAVRSCLALSAPFVPLALLRQIRVRIGAARQGIR